MMIYVLSIWIVTLHCYFAICFSTLYILLIDFNCVYFQGVCVYFPGVYFDCR
ncbi:hypothetical protein HanHA300_Chr13g0485981 [Helianthus annuus]|nr:hypothetical protein HanHA300_Chr13g0485981 [Helianthus annuus]KAJ0498059.1 hypothetical protein HanHA89_Chr13g0518121 [Helianthus annuus]KAJ0664058.1 hypothetical protein HanLR1_Chr13g0487951 [Helianthus annuus]